MNTFTRKKLHAEILENLTVYIDSLDKDLKQQFNSYSEELARLEKDSENHSYRIESKKQILEEINAKSNFITKVIEYLEKMQL